VRASSLRFDARRQTFLTRLTAEVYALARVNADGTDRAHRRSSASVVIALSAKKYVGGYCRGPESPRSRRHESARFAYFANETLRQGESDAERFSGGDVLALKRDCCAGCAKTAVRVDYR
jgi:hypothetical protein